MCQDVDLRRKVFSYKSIAFLARALAARASTSLFFLLLLVPRFSQILRFSKFLDFQTSLTFARAYSLKSFKLFFIHRFTSEFRVFQRFQIEEDPNFRC